MTTRIALWLAVALFGILPRSVHAGMPTLTLSDFGRMRVWTISFFLFVILVCAFVVQRIWNSLAVDFPKLPRLTYKRSLGGVFLWGLLFIIVLTMISGARELMTPGAWVKQGFTYRLSDAANDARPGTETSANDGSSRLAERKAQLQALAARLDSFAKSHDSKFPSGEGVREVPDDVWQVPNAFGQNYGYVSGRSRNDGAAILAYEPDVFGGTRLALLCNGEVVNSSSAEIARALQTGPRP